MPAYFSAIAAVAVCLAAFILLSTRRPTDSPSNSLEQRRALYQSPTSTMPAYEAPAHNCDLPTRIPHSYFVFLHQGYSLEQHKHALGDSVDLDSAIPYIFPDTESRGLYYTAELRDNGIAAVRADIGVDMAECDTEIYLID